MWGGPELRSVLRPTLADVIEDYLEYFPIDMKAFCEWARENVEYTSDEGGV